MTELPYVKLATSTHDRSTVDNYEQVYKQQVVSLEITKPSEQAFKALATPSQRGGAILLFSQPIGRQEYDNLHFLRNHGMMPSKHIHELLWQYAEKQTVIHEYELLEDSHQWRALRLPDTPQKASQFILWCHTQGIFSRMIRYKRKNKGTETDANGVEQFWSTVSMLMQKLQLS
jgi:hypothetical protein